MDAKLVVTSGAKPASIALRLPTVIGRSADAQLKVKQHNVSRKHCEIFTADDQLKIRDLGSSNGTIVNGQRINGEFVLSPGDEVTIGTVGLCVVFRPGGVSDTVSHQAAAHKSDREAKEAIPKNEPSSSTGSQEESRDQDGVDDVKLDVKLDGSAVLNYQDLEDGSFIAIELEEPLPPAVESTIHLEVEETVRADESQIRLDIDARESAPVDDDSRLHDFLEGLNGQ